MPNQAWVAPLITNAGQDGTSLSSSTTATSILPAVAKYTIPSNFLFNVGQKLRVRGMCRVSNIVTTPGTLTLDIRFGATVVFNGGAMQMSTTAHTTLPLHFDFELQLRTPGSTAALMGYGKVVSQVVNISSADSATGHSILVVPNVTPVVGNTFDATASQQVDMFATFSISNAANLIQLHDYVLESIN